MQAEDIKRLENKIQKVWRKRYAILEKNTNTDQLHSNQILDEKEKKKTPILLGGKTYVFSGGGSGGGALHRIADEDE